MLFVPISVGELIDKITILKIKMEMIKDADKLLNVSKELTLLARVFIDNIKEDNVLNVLIDQLYQVNQELWLIEDYKRACEKDQIFDSGFVNASRQVYQKNDLRASIKREINRLTNSMIVEEKSFYLGGAIGSAAVSKTEG